MRISIMKNLCLPVVTLFAFLLLLALMAGPASSEGVEMPDTIIIKYIQKEYSPVTFDHAMHADMADSCGVCHHIHDMRINTTCSNCHLLDSDAFKSSANHGFPPCSGCHMDYSLDEPGMPGLKVALHRKCFGCHVGMGELGSSPSGCVEMCHTR
jgi:hypothetical protein